MRAVVFVALVVVGLVVDPLLLMWLVSTVHDWWPLVPVMSYGQAFGLTFVGTVCVWAAVAAYLAAAVLD